MLHSLRTSPRKQGFLPALVVAALVAQPAAAGINRWTAFGPGAGTVQTLLADPVTPGVLYALTTPGQPDYTGGEVYRSDDAGASWKWSGTGLPFSFRGDVQVHALALDPVRAALYITYGSRVFRSVDGAAHWVPAGATGLVGDPHSSCALAVAAGDPGAVFLAYGRHLVRSTDQGGSWKPLLETAADIKTLLVNPTAPHVLYVGISGGRGNWISTDGGETFGTMEGMGDITAFAAPPFGPPGLLYAAGGEVVYASIDGGSLWRQKGRVGRPINALAVDSGSPTLVYAAHDRGVSVSRDGGETWSEAGTGLPREFGGFDLYYPEQALSLAGDPARPGTVYAGLRSSGVFVSANSGRSWKSGTQRGLVTAFTFPAFAIHRAFPTTMYLVTGYTSGILWRSSDGGQTWAKMSDNSRGFNIINLALDPVDPQVVYATSGGLYRSLDGGATWSRRGPSSIRSIVVTSQRDLVAGTPSSILRSTDGGNRWETVLTQWPSTKSVDCCVVRADESSPTTVYALASEYDGGSMTQLVLRSKNGGATWRRFLSGTSVNIAPAPSRPGTIYAAIGMQSFPLLRTVDDGKHWDAVGPPPQSAYLHTLVVDSQDPMTLLVGTDHLGVLRSTDGGATWTEVSAGLTRLGRISVPNLVAHPSAPHTFYALPDPGGVFEVRFSE